MVKTGGWFTLKWVHVATGYVFDTNYWTPAGKPDKNHKLSCIAFGKREGFKYLGQVRG